MRGSAITIARRKVGHRPVGGGWSGRALMRARSSNRRWTPRRCGSRACRERRSSGSSTAIWRAWSGRTSAQWPPRSPRGRRSHHRDTDCGVALRKSSELKGAERSVHASDRVV